jgi:hypothetical protein
VLVALPAPLDVGENRIGPPMRTGRFLVRSVLLVDDLGGAGRLRPRLVYRRALSGPRGLFTVPAAASIAGTMMTTWANSVEDDFLGTLAEQIART